MADRIDVFISSTSRDLEAYRERVTQVVLRLGLYPIVMEAFNPTDRTALQVCYDKVQDAEIFVGIYAYRYGYAPGSDVTYTTGAGETRTGDGETGITHWEYQWAVERGLPMLLFVISETDPSGNLLPWPPAYIDNEPGKSRLSTFKNVIMGKHVVGFFHSPDHLATQVATGLTELINNRIVGNAAQNAPSVFQAVSPPDTFVGREREVAVIHQQLENETAAIIIRGGVGGLGKTALAAYVAHMLRDQYRDGVLWARLDTNDTMSILASFISAFGEKQTGMLRHLTTAEARASYYRSLLSGKCCLVVLDNAESAKQVLPLLMPGGASRVLVTTRYAISNAIPNSYEMQLSNLSEEGASELLLRLIGRSGDVNGKNGLIAKLCQELGYLPLAIQIAADIIRELGWDLEHYFVRLRESNTLDWLSDEGLSQSVRASFAISYENLPDDVTRKAFRLLGIFPKSTFQSAVVAHLLGSTSDATERILLSLRRWGLVEIDRSKPDGFGLHPLMHRYALELLTQATEAEAVHSAAGDYYRKQISRWEMDSKQFMYGDVPVEADIEAEAENGLDAVYHYFEAKRLDEAQEVLVASADPLTLQGRERELIGWVEKLDGDGNVAPWLQLYYGMWMAYGKSKHKRQRGLDMLEALAKSQDKKLASAAFIGLAQITFQDEHYEEARQFLDQSLELKAQIEPPDQKGIAYIQNELARICLRAGGSPQETFVLHEKAFELQKQTSDTKGMSYTLRKMGALCLYHMQDSAKANHLFAESKKLAHIAGDRVGLISILSEEAELLRINQRYVEAAEVLQEARELALRCNQPLSEAYVLKRLSQLYEAAEIFGEAYDYATQSRELFGQLEQRQAVKLDTVIRRLDGVKLKLGAELSELDNKIRQAETQLTETQNTGTDEDRQSQKSELRILLRRRKRVRQKLGLEPALIRLGKR